MAARIRSEKDELAAEKCCKTPTPYYNRESWHTECSACGAVINKDGFKVLNHVRRTWTGT